MSAKCRKLPSEGFVEMSAMGNYQPFNASGNIHQITRLKRLLYTHSGQKRVVQLEYKQSV
jgi:hypothetical protein